MAATTAAVIGAAAAAKGAIDQGKAAKAAANAANNGQPAVNIPQVAGMAHDQAIQNAIDSQKLEKQLTPEVSDLRRSGILNLLSSMGQGNPYGDSVQSGLFQDFNSPVSGIPLSRSALLDQAIGAAGSDLALGGALPQDVRNQIFRSSAASAAGAGGGGLGLGRDVVARDLGLNSLSLRNQRLNTASGLGQVDQGILTQDRDYQTNLALANRSSRANLAQLLQSLGSNDIGQKLAIAQFGQSIAMPTVGLDPSSIANLAVGNSNYSQAAKANANNLAASSANSLMNFGSGLFGVGMGLNKSGGGLYGGYTSQPYTSFQTQQPNTISSVLQQQNTFGLNG